METTSFHADFSMNTLFYDFKNDIIIDKTGIGIPVVKANRCDIPCPLEQWSDWVDINGCRVFFRLYKFLLRGYEYDREEMSFVATKLLEDWSQREDHTIEVGRIALGNLVETKDEKKLATLQDLVTASFALATVPEDCPFQTANSWWQDGWLKLLKLAT